MRSISRVFITLFLVASVRADVVETRDAILFGKVLSSTPTRVVIAVGCNKRQVREIDGTSVRSLIFDKNCRTYPGKLPTAGMQPPCDRKRVTVYEVTFISGGSVLAETVSLNEKGRLVAGLGIRGSISGPRSDVAHVVRREVCPNLLDDEPSFPTSFCLEPFRPVVNFGVEPIFNNQIFTRGFTVYVAFDGPVGDAERAQAIENVTQALRTSTLIWVSLLQENRERLPGRLQEYLGTVVSRSPKFQILSSPGVTEVDCPVNAMMIVNWITAGEKTFPRRREYLAKAQVQGRTILVNARDFRYRWNLRRTAALERGEVDLITVMLHEFGHSLGLGHAPENTPSVMSSHDPSAMPTPYDFDTLVAILEKSIRGTVPGDFNLSYCSGLRPGGRKVGPAQ